MDTRETLQNKGFRSDVAAFYIFEPFGRVDMARFCRPVLRIIFLRGLLFCMVRCSKFCRNWVSRAKNPWGCRTELVLKRPFFAVCPLRAQIWRAGGARPCRFFFSDLGSLPKMSLRLRCGGFFRLFRCFFFFFFDPVFENLKWSFSHPPLFLWVFFSFVRILLGIGGNAALHVCFWAVGLQPLLFFGGLWGLLRKALFFPLKKGYLGSFLSVSLLCLPFVLLGFFHFSLSLSLSLSLSFFFLVFFLPCCLVFIFTFLVFLLLFLVLLLRFRFMRRRTSKYYI